MFDEAFPLMVSRFNDYSLNKGLNITLQMILYTESNSTQGYVGVDATLDLMRRKKNKYDLFAYDPLYLRNFSPYLLELDEWLDQELLDAFSANDVRAITDYNNHRYGIPVIMIYSVLFSNTRLLKRHNRNIPKTWDELIDTAKFIMKEEADKYNNTELIGYNGFFPDGENSFASFYQFLLSYRDGNESEPDYRSQYAIDALNKLKQMQTEISSYEIFRSSEQVTYMGLNSETLLFAWFWSTIKVPNYQISLLPNKRENMTSTVLGGYNLGINKYIEDERKLAAIEVLKYLSSEEIQTDIILKKSNLISPLKSLYQD
ncbi:periplasmic binding protein-like II, partial [Anaeromyces robustus]